MNSLQVLNVSKSFGKQEVLKNINLTINGGTTIGLVGENGSGKTVLMKLMIGLMKPVCGKIIYNGAELKKDFDYLPSVGFIIEHPEFYDDLTAFENLELLAGIKKLINKNTIVEWIERVGLSNDRKPIENYSLGMKQRLGIAQAMMENPEVIILDEVTNSLDTEGVDLVHSLIKDEKDKKKIIVISSHSRYDIEKLCDEIYYFRNGGICRDV